MEKGDWKYSVGLIAILLGLFLIWKLILLDFFPWLFSKQIVKLILWEFPKRLLVKQIMKDIVLSQAVTFVIYLYVKKGRISFFEWPYK